MHSGLAISRVGKLIPKRQKRWMQSIQKRVGLIQNIISMMKGFEISRFSEFASAKVQTCRTPSLTFREPGRMFER